MPEWSENKAVERSCRLFRRLLVAYPKAHREEYGAAILQLFRDQCRDAWAENRARGLMGFWLHALCDLLKTSVLEHLSNINRRKSMLNLFRPSPKLLFVFGAVFIAVFVLTVGGSIVMTLMLPKAYASSSRIMVAHTVAQPPSSFSDRYELVLFQSHAVLNKTSEALGLSKVWGKKYNNGEPLNEFDVESILKSRLEFRTLPIRQNSTLGPLAPATMVEIRAFSDSPEEAAKLANGVAEAYRGFREEQLAQSATPPVERRVTIMDSAVPQPRAVRPNVPLNIVIGILLGTVMGAFCGTVAAGLTWLVGRRRGSTGSRGQPASSDIPA